MNKGKIIVIEGTDCSGKETQCKLLVQNLIKLGKKAIMISFPRYDTPTGKIVGGPYLGRKDICNCYFEEGAVKVDPKISCLYYAADRKYNIEEVLKYVNAGYYVILDRYTSSNMAHQGCKILNKDDRFNMFQWIDKLEYWLLELPKPDKTIFLYVPYDYSKKLKCQRQDALLDDEHEKNEEYLINSFNCYLELSELYNWDRVNCIGNEGLKSIDEIGKDVLNCVIQK